LEVVRESFTGGSCGKSEGGRRAVRARDGCRGRDVAARRRGGAGAARRGWDGGRWMQMDGERDDGGRLGRGSGNVPFEFVGEVARAGAVAEARDVERGAAAARHGSMRMGVCGGC
jgi:hypothetical protein